MQTSWRDMVKWIWSRQSPIPANCYFIQLAQQVGAQDLRDMAVRFGFSKADLLADTLQTAQGNLPDAEQLENPAELANFGFGQGLLTANPNSNL